MIWIVVGISVTLSEASRIPVSSKPSADSAAVVSHHPLVYQAWCAQLKAANEDSEEEARVGAEDDFVGVVLSQFSLYDLLESHVGEAGVVVESGVTQPAIFRSRNVMLTGQ